MSKLYALIVGINNYAPSSKVSALSGCLNDAIGIEIFLKKYFKDVLTKSSIKKLLNEKATRENIITTFQSHLIEKAKPGDTVLFYYAGHGSYTESAAIFKKFDGKEQDETFVCYDSRLPGHYDLADKEMAVLLHRIKKGVHTVFIADSCHSASITRGSLGKSRFYNGKLGKRSLASYLLEGDNYYSKKLTENKGKIVIPHASYILLSGCERDESSFETDDRRGLFTTKLLALLHKHQNISYKTLFDSVRISVFKESDQEQHPTISAFEGFNPNMVFLRSDIIPNARHAIRFEEEKWRMENGAIYGLPTESNKIKDIQIGIYLGVSTASEFIHQSKVSKVNLTNVCLENTKGLEVGITYWGEILNLPAAIVVNLVGELATKLAFLKVYRKNPSPYFQFSEDFKEAKYTLKLNKEISQLIITKTTGIVFEQEGFSQTSVKAIKEKIAHVARWETVASLENKNKDTELKEAIEVKFYEEPKKNVFKEIEGENIILDYFKTGDDRVTIKQGKHKGKEIGKPLFYKIEARNVSNQPLHVTLLSLNASFGIRSYFESKGLAPNSDWKAIDVGHYLNIANPEVSQETEIFKIIISNKPFDSTKFLMAKLVKNKREVVEKEEIDISWEDLEEEPKEDWFTKTITVNIIRKNEDIGKNKGAVKLDKEGITFEEHNHLSASFAFAAVNNKTSRNLKPWGQLDNYLKGEGLTLLNFAEKTRGAIDKTVIELSNITQEDTLKEQPLTLTLNQSLADNESIVPVTYDGEFLIPLGYSEKKEDGSVKVNINYLPTYEDTSRKRKKRSITKAAWFVMLKMVGLTDSVFKVRWVQYKLDGSINRNTLRLRQKVDRAKKILLVTHGIIGDTKPMIRNLAFLLADHHYDLMLVYDYENLNTKIENIAEKLNERLEKLGLGANDGKNLHILAHSMGGLVSRHLIEKLREGDDMVDRLFMFGTPNAGSPFGEIPKFRNKMIALMSIGMNFGMGLGWIGVAMEMANKALMSSTLLTQTLEQMSGESSFIQNLRKSKKGHASYTVVAGDINKYKPTADGRFARFKDNVLLKIGNYASADEPNDIAVVVDDILNIPTEIGAASHEIACHHMNYFEEGASMKKLKEVMVGIVEV